MKAMNYPGRIKKRVVVIFVTAAAIVVATGLLEFGRGHGRVTNANTPQESGTKSLPSPLDAPRRAAVDTGIYMPRLPSLPKLDLRVEAVYTNTPAADPRPVGGEYVYWEQFYHDLYTNNGNLIGSWIGRQGQALQAQSTYWFSPRNSLQLGYRHAKVASDFIPGGETINDGSAKLEWWIREDVSVSGFVQYEKWLAPILARGAQTNWTSSVQVTFWPRPGRLAP
jgi:Capsule assembly protein Wzi